MAPDERRSGGTGAGSPNAVRSAPAPSPAEALLAGLLARGLEALGTTARDDDGEQRPLRLLAPAPGNGSSHLVLELDDAPKYGSEHPADWARRTVARLLPEPGALGDYLEHMPPGERLSTLLTAIDPDKVDDFSLVEVVAAFKRLEAWSAARSTRAAAVLAERDAVNPTWPGSVRGRTRGECVVGEELAMRLRVSKMSAIRMVACGRGFSGLFEPTGDALERGLIDFPRAQAIVTTLEELPADIAMAAQLDVLEKAPGRTLRQVHNDLAKAVIAADPDAADERHRVARQQRRVNRPRPLPDGMAAMSTVLPAADAIALDTALDAAARAARNNGDRRTLDQLRADCLALMGHTALAEGFIGPHPGVRCTCGCTPPPDASAPAAPSGGAGSTSPPGTPAGTAVSRPGAGTPMPGPARTPSSNGTAFGLVPSAGGPPTPGHRLPCEGLPRIKLGTLGGGRSDVRITIPIHLLVPGARKRLGTATDHAPDQVAELEGYGPIPAVMARALSEGGVWRRLVTDPAGFQVLDVGRTRYQPPAAIADHVRERDRTCVMPTCSSPARSCELDHIHEWQHGGVTSAENLGPMCSSSNRLKSIGAFTVAYGSDRTYAWTTPTGHGYLRRPDGTTVTLPRRTAAGLRKGGVELSRTGRAPDPTLVDDVLAEVSAGTDIGGTWEPRGGAPAHHWPGVEYGPSWDGSDEPPF